MTDDTTSSGEPRADASRPASHDEPGPVSTWMDPRPRTEQRIAMEAIAEQLRQAHAVLHDADASESELAEVLVAATALREITDRLPVRDVTGSPVAPAESPETLSFVDVSPMSGASSGVAPPLRLELDGREVVGRVRFGRTFEGPPGHVHGGWVASAFDEVMGVAQGLDEAPGMTATLEISYRRPTPIDTDLVFRAWVDDVRGRRIHTKAELRRADPASACGVDESKDGLLCEAKGLFVTVDFDALRARLGQG